MEPIKLEKICSNSPEIFEASKDTMFLDPRTVDITLEDAIIKATKFEKERQDSWKISNIQRGRFEGLRNASVSILS